MKDIKTLLSDGSDPFVVVECLISRFFELDFPAIMKSPDPEQARILDAYDEQAPFIYKRTSD